MFNCKAVSIAALAFGLTASTPLLAATAVDADQPSVVIVHGAFADGSDWAKVIPLLQAKGVQTAQDVSRLLVNTVLGLGGLFDPATGMGLESHNEDFGQTLGYWGVPSGPYLMLPILGPSTIRDTVALPGDWPSSQ